MRWWVVPISEDAAYTLGTEHGQASIGEGDGRHRLAGDEHLPSRIGRMEDSAPPHRLLEGGGPSPRLVGGPVSMPSGKESQRGGEDSLGDDTRGGGPQ